MRKFVLTFMVLVMLTPAMACAMAYDVKAAQAAEQEKEPCHQSAETKQDDGVILILDCLGVDLFQQQVADITAQPDLSVEPVDFDARISVASTADDTALYPIRAPPDRAGALLPSNFVLMTTQRFRL